MNGLQPRRPPPTSRPTACRSPPPHFRPPPAGRSAKPPHLVTLNPSPPPDAPLSPVGHGALPDNSELKTLTTATMPQSERIVRSRSRTHLVAGSLPRVAGLQPSSVGGEKARAPSLRLGRDGIWEKFCGASAPLEDVSAWAFRIYVFVARLCHGKMYLLEHL